MTEPPVTAIVVHWNYKDITLQCLQSLVHLSYPTRVIVVDNGSSERLGVTFNSVPAELIVLERNLGFGAACNIAISRALEDQSCKYIFLLNNDTVVHPDAVAELVKAAESNPQAGVFGPKIYYSDRPHVIWYAGARQRWGVLAATDTGRGQVDNGQFDTRGSVDFVFGAAMFVRRTVFEKIGLFDESFFLYLEDLDFCLRARNAGFSLLFVPKALVWHKGSASFTNNRAMRRYYLVKSTFYFLRKHTTLLTMPLVFLFWTLVSLRMLLTDTIKGDWNVIKWHLLGAVESLFQAKDNAYGKVEMPFVQKE